MTRMLLAAVCASALSAAVAAQAPAGTPSPQGNASSGAGTQPGATSPWPPVGRANNRLVARGDDRMRRARRSGEPGRMAARSRTRPTVSTSC